MAKKKKKKGAKKSRARSRAPTLKDALAAVRAKKLNEKDDGKYHMLTSVEGTLRKLGA